MTSELKSMFGENCPEQTDLTHQNTNKDLEKKKKEYMKKQTGLKRELIKLIGGVPSIVEKTGNIGQKNTKWIWTPFSNPARQDQLKLVHWQRASDINKEYEPSKLNKSIEIVEFTKEEYEKLIQPNDRNWNYEQTMYLWDLIKRYELRFIVIMDRFDEEKYGERTVESLKDRYYSVARTILEHRKNFDHPIIKSGYNYEQEMKRRIFLEKTMNKSFDEIKEEERLLELAKNLNKKMEANQKFEEALYKKLNEINPVNDNQGGNIQNEGEEGEDKMNIEKNDITNKINIDKLNLGNENMQTFEDYIKNNITRNDSFVYLRSQKLKHNLPVSEKIQERVDNYMKEFNIQHKIIPTERVEILYDNLRNNIILYTTLKKYLEKKDKEYRFLQEKFREYQAKTNPKIALLNINNTPSMQNPQIKMIQKPDNKSNNLFIKPNQKNVNQNEIKESINQGGTQELTNNTIINRTNMQNNSIDQSVASSQIQNNTSTITQDNKNVGKRRKINGTPKPRKRKNANDEETETQNEDKEPKSNSKKKKKGTK